MKKIVYSIIVIIVFAIIFLLIYNPGDQPYNEIDNPKQNIMLYHYFSGTLSGGINEMIGEINSKQKVFQVKAQPLDHEAFKTMIHMALIEGESPELFSYWAGEKVQELVNQEKLLPIDDVWTKFAFNKKFQSSLIKAACTYNQKKYFLPIDQHVVLFFYNTSIFEKNNLEPPANWNDFLTLCKKLKSKNITPIALGSRERWPAQFWFDYILLRTAGYEFRTRLMNGDEIYTSPEVVKAYKLWSEIISNNYFNENSTKLDWAEATDYVGEGKAAMTLMGTWAIQQLTGEKHKLIEEKDFDFFAFPTINENISRTALGPVDGLVLAKNSVNPEYAKQVLAYFAEIESQKKFSKGSGALSPNILIQPDFYTPLQQRIKSEITKCPNWAFNYDLATPIQIAEIGMNSFIEILEFPKQYKTILDEIQKNVDKINTTK